MKPLLIFSLILSLGIFTYAATPLEEPEINLCQECDEASLRDRIKSINEAQKDTMPSQFQVFVNPSNADVYRYQIGKDLSIVRVLPERTDHEIAAQIKIIYKRLMDKGVVLSQYSK